MFVYANFLLDYKIDSNFFCSLEFNLNEIDANSMRFSLIFLRVERLHKITCSMRLSARRANDSRRPELATGIVGGNGGDDMSNVLIFIFYKAPPN